MEPVEEVLGTLNGTLWFIVYLRKKHLKQTVNKAHDGEIRLHRRRRHHH